MCPSNYQASYKALYHNLCWYFGRFLIITGLIASGFTWLAVFADFPLIIAVITGAVFILGAIATVTSVSGFHRTLQIQLLLEHEGAIFHSSNMLAHAIPELDRWAEGARVERISRFVITENLTSYPIVWHAPDSALPTVQALLRAVEVSPLRSDKSKDVQNDLLLIHQALQSARERGKKFTLHLHYGYCQQTPC